jgi:hypothetical protein
MIRIGSDGLLRRLSGRADRPPPNIVFGKCIHGLRGDADSVEDADVRESSSRAELVYRRLADPKPARDIANGVRISAIVIAQIGAS